MKTAGAKSEPVSCETALSDEDFRFICDVVYEQSRIHLSDEKRVLVASRLAKRLRQLQLADYHSYCERLRSADGGEELRFLIDLISTNHTRFFRENKHFEFLRNNVFPEWELRADDRAFCVWSAACSTGEEPYSIAIQLAEHFESGRAAWEIEASDISTRVLETAQRGIYEAGRLGGVPDELLRRYFQKGVRNWEGAFRVKEPLRERVRFHHLNLLQPAYPFSKPFQVIFCRNVMIYFDRPTQETLVRRLSEQLAPGGYLMVGHSESLSGVKHSLKLIQPAIYRKV